MKRNISVVIPNYNGRNLISDCINSAISALEFEGCEYEIIIPDDASTDGSEEFIRTTFPEIILVTSIQNSGFSVNINKGIRQSRFDLLLLLNSDVQLSQDYFTNLLHYFDDSSVFGLMGRIAWKDGRIQDAAKYPQLKGTQLVSTKNTLPLESATYFPTLFLSGANALVDRKKLLELGGMDEIYSPYYYEDVDLSLRAWRLGWKCLYEDKAICYHATSSTIGTHKKRKVKIIAKRNKFLLHFIHLQGEQRFAWWLEMFFNFLFRWIAADWVFYQSFFNFYKKLPEAKVSRRRFNTLQEKYGSDKSVSEIVQQIKAGIKGKSKGDIF